MKKAIIGTLAGVVLLAGVAVSAAEVKNAIIGKKVGGVMSVSIDGKSIGKEAIIIDGVSYLPVRDAAEALGGEVTGVANRHITIESKGGASMTEDVTTARIESLTEQVKLKQERIKLLEDYIAEYPDRDNDHLAVDITRLKTEIAELEAQLAGLTAE